MFHLVKLTGDLYQKHTVNLSNKPVLNNSKAKACVVRVREQFQAKYAGCTVTWLFPHSCPPKACLLPMSFSDNSHRNERPIRFNMTVSFCLAALPYIQIFFHCILKYMIAFKKLNPHRGIKTAFLDIWSQQ